MPPSMRAQRKRDARRSLTVVQKRETRKRAVDLLKIGNTSYRAVSEITGVPKSTIGELAACLRTDDSEKLKRLLNPIEHSVGQQSILSNVEEEMIVDRVNFAASRGFSMNHEDLKRTMARIASDGRKTW